jgi:hypothetical protein
VEVDAFGAGRTVTLRWVSDDVRLFQEVERHLRETVPTLAIGENPASRWLMSGAVGCIVMSAFCAVLLVYGLQLAR